MILFVKLVVSLPFQVCGDYVNKRRNHDFKYSFEKTSKRQAFDLIFVFSNIASVKTKKIAVLFCIPDV